MVMGKDFTIRYSATDEPEIEVVSPFQSIRADIFPHVLSEMVVYLQLTDGPRFTEGRIVCLGTDGRPIFASQIHRIRFRRPLDVEHVVFRIKNCPFPEPGMYMVLFKCDDTIVTDRKLILELTERG